MHEGRLPNLADSPEFAAVLTAAAAAADDVDLHARFPAEAVELLKQGRFLSCSLPVGAGGQASGIRQLAQMARRLGAACSSAGMVFAMHHNQALALAHHGHGDDFQLRLQAIAAEEALLASATTEVTTGGDLSSSLCAVVPDGDDVVIQKDAPVISYAEYADYICVTARRTPDSPPTDQVLVVCPARDTVLEQISTWDVLGFRGTCSPGFSLKARTASGHVLTTEFSTILGATMLPVSHILWASVWLGMADTALDKARAAARQSARKAAGGTTTQVAKLTQLNAAHQDFHATVSGAIRTYERFLESGLGDVTISFTTSMNNLKIAASTAVMDIVIAALQLIGLNAYREDHPLSLTRLLRDSFAPQLMVSNDRIRANNELIALAYHRPSEFV